MVGIFIIGVLMLVAAVGVIVSRPPVHSALMLIGVTMGLAFIYLILSAEFLAAAQVIVYAGAIMVLFLFVVTLLTAGKEEREGVDALPGQRWTAVIAATVIGGGLAWLAVAHQPPAVAGSAAGLGTLHNVGQALWGPDFILLMGVVLMLLTAAVGVLVLNRPETAEPRSRQRRLPAGVEVVREEDGR